MGVTKMNWERCSDIDGGVPNIFITDTDAENHAYCCLFLVNY